jgi:tol-pal system protein YbgF
MRISAFILVLLLAVPGSAQASSNNRNGGVSSDYLAILETRIQTLEDQLRSMTGQLEQAQFQSRTATERLARLEEDMNTRFRMLESQTAAAAATAPIRGAGAPVTLTAQGTAVANPDTNRLGELTGGAIAPVLPDDPNIAYDQAFQKIRGGDYEAAESALRAFLQRWPRNELSSNASYWLGETYYVRGDYPAAAKAFAEGYQAYPKGAKAEDTLLKLGLTLSVLNRKNDACVTFAQMSSEFPRMSATNRRRLEQENVKLECPATSTRTSSRNR